MKDFISACLLIVLSLGTLSWLIPLGVEDAGAGDNLALSPAFWPQIVAWLVLGLSLLLALQSGIRLLTATRTRSASDAPAPATAARSRGFEWRMLIAIVLLLPYYLLMPSLGLLLTSMLALAAYSLLAGERNYGAIIAWAVLGPLALSLFFIKVAQVLIPLGPLKGLL